MQSSADSEAVGANTTNVQPAPDPGSDRDNGSENVPKNKRKRQRKHKHEHGQPSASAKGAAVRKKPKRPLRDDNHLGTSAGQETAAPHTAVNAKVPSQSRPTSEPNTSGPRGRGRPKKNVEWEVEAIVAARHASDSTRDEPRFQYAVRWASSAGGETSWWTAESLQNDPLVLLELSKSLADGSVTFKHTRQPDDEEEGALVAEGEL